jgi:DNA-directed RNA polymerase subunit E'/Rpb7
MRLKYSVSEVRVLSATEVLEKLTKGILAAVNVCAIINAVLEHMRPIIATGDDAIKAAVWFTATS